jgi:hypothetical protein
MNGNGFLFLGCCLGGVRARMPNFVPKKTTSWREVENNKEKYKLGNDRHNNNNNHHHLDRTYHLQIAILY